MRVVLDTNVLMAAFISQGYCHELYQPACLAHTIVISPQIVAELKKNLTKKLLIRAVKQKQSLIS